MHILFIIDTNLLLLISRSNNVLCHLRMTPLRAAAQHVKDAPHTTPAKKGPEIGSRAYCETLIFSGPPLRMILNGSLQIAEGRFVQKQMCSTFFGKHLIRHEKSADKQIRYSLGSCFYIYLYRHRYFFKFPAYF